MFMDVNRKRLMPNIIQLILLFKKLKTYIKPFFFFPSIICFYKKTWRQCRKGPRVWAKADGSWTDEQEKQREQFSSISTRVVRKSNREKIKSSVKRKSWFQRRRWWKWNPEKSKSVWRWLFLFFFLVVFLYFRLLVFGKIRLRAADDKVK